MRLIDKLFLIGIFAETTLPIEVWAGNSENGTADLDLVVRNKNQKKLNEEIITKLYQKIKETKFTNLVHIKDWSVLPQTTQQNVLSEYEMFYDSSDKVIEPESFQEPFENSYQDTKTTIQFFNFFEESENYSRLKMAKMSPEERLIQLKKIRTISGKLAPAKHSSGSNLLTIKIEMGDSK
jgi:hypothetical protein